MQRTPWCLCAALCAISLVAPAEALAGTGGRLKIEVVDRDTGSPLACRMHLTNAGGRALKAPRVPYWHDHFAFDGTVTLKLAKGEYDFVIDRGPEYLEQRGHFTMDNFSQDTQIIELKRFVDMAAEGWWSGDLDAARPADDLPLLMKAEDLHVVELITWPGREVLLPSGKEPINPIVQFDDNRFYHSSAGIDARAGGTLLYFNLPEPLDIGGLSGGYPPQQEAVAEAKQHAGAWVDAQKAYGWDVPLWVAAGQLDSVQVLNSNLRRKEVASSERDGKPRDELVYPAPYGNGRWSEAIYYHLLNCGLRIPPTAGSGSGQVANPLGYNRMYVHVDGDLTYEKWWQGVAAGRVIVTNGPLIRPTVEGEMPGYVFRADEGQVVELEIGLTMSSRDNVSYIEVIKNGEVVQSVRVAQWAENGGRLPPVVFEQSGWLLLRAATDVSDTYRYAMTAPYYVEIGDKPRVSRQSVQFFLDWLKQRTVAVKLEVTNPEQQAAVLEYHDQARAYWEDLLSQANAP
ncbi:MAG: hypothetical protein DWQ37_03820 [Planctomycetota bacterium]|nr:MAG: hypothetical protein DWQ37_03820 [Planctomycetota bacterium]